MTVTIPVDRVLSGQTQAIRNMCRFYACRIGWIILVHLTLSTSAGFLDGIQDLAKCSILDDNCPSDKVSYWLYNRENQNTPYRLEPELESSLALAPLSPTAEELVVLIHGYTGNRDYSPNTELRPAYLSYGDYNIITVDWGQAAKAPCYLHAALNVNTVGKCSTMLLKQMLDLHPGILSIKQTHVVGFSLGAHVAGMMGKTYKQFYNESFPRITGLDPALPLFDSLTTTSKFFLYKDDAEFVDVIHTNAGRKGRLFQVGTVDFYVNNAGIQPGCLSNWSCDHVRAVEVFAESISSQVGFWGSRCEVQAAQFLIGFVSEACGLLKSHASEPPVLMGEHVDTSVSGTYLVRTRSHPPFAYGRTQNDQVTAREGYNSGKSLDGSPDLDDLQTYVKGAYTEGNMTYILVFVPREVNWLDKY